MGKQDEGEWRALRSASDKVFRAASAGVEGGANERAASGRERAGEGRDKETNGDFATLKM